MHKYNLLVETPVMRALKQNKTFIRLLTKLTHSYKNFLGTPKNFLYQTNS